MSDHTLIVDSFVFLVEYRALLWAQATAGGDDSRQEEKLWQELQSLDELISRIKDRLQQMSEGA